MHTVTIGSKNQRVIPLEIRKKIQGLKPGRKIAIFALNEDTITLKVTRENWLESAAGAMQDAWKALDPVSEVEKMRDEWDE